jgi:chaperone modulatory protein CbpM
MRDDDVLIASLIEEAGLALERVAAACAVEREWLQRHVEEGFFPRAEFIAGVWFLPGSSLGRALRIRQFERDFDATPELAALVADMLEEMDELRARLGVKIQSP